MEPADAGAVKGAPKPGDPSPAIGSEAQAKLAGIRARLETSVGQVVLMMMQLPRYRHQALADLNHLVVEPLLRDRVAIAFAEVKEGEGVKTGHLVTVGAAIWASVSEKVDAKIKEQIATGAFPVRLGTDEWVSGERLWLLDVVASDRRSASSVLVNFKRVAKGKEFQVHPSIARQVDTDLIKKLKTR